MPINMETLTLLPTTTPTTTPIDLKSQTTIVIPTNTTILTNGMFSGYTNAREIIIPPTVTVIENDVFRGW